MIWLMFRGDELLILLLLGFFTDLFKTKDRTRDLCDSEILSCWLINVLFAGARLEGTKPTEWYIIISSSLLWFRDPLKSDSICLLFRIGEKGLENYLSTIAKQFDEGTNSGMKKK